MAERNTVGLQIYKYTTWHMKLTVYIELRVGVESKHGANKIETIHSFYSDNATSIKAAINDRTLQ